MIACSAILELFYYIYAFSHANVIVHGISSSNLFFSCRFNRLMG